MNPASPSCRQEASRDFPLNHSTHIINFLCEVS